MALLSATHIVKLNGSSILKANAIIAPCSYLHVDSALKQVFDCHAQDLEL